MNPLGVIISMGAIGLASSFTHCVGMCGPLQIMLSRTAPGLKPALLYHGGRIIGYCISAVLLSFVAMSVELPETNPYRFLGPWLMATFFLYIALHLLGVPVLPKILGLKLFPHKFYQRLIARERSVQVLLTLGFLNALLPCGITWTALALVPELPGPVWALGGMLFFALGTTPFFLILSHGKVGGRILEKKIFQRILGVVFLVLAGLKVAYALSGGMHSMHGG